MNALRQLDDLFDDPGFGLQQEIRVIRIASFHIQLRGKGTCMLLRTR